MNSVKTNAQALNQIVGARIAQFREAACLSLPELAKRSRISLDKLARLESGEITMTVAELWELATELKINVEDVFCIGESRRRGTDDIMPTVTGSRHLRQSLDIMRLLHKLTLDRQRTVFALTDFLFREQQRSKSGP